MKKAVIAIILLFTLLLSGCGETVRTVFYCTASTVPQTMDPQLATDPTALMIIENCFEGLMRLDPDGNLAPAAAESFSVSDDGLVYRFKLYEGLLWNDGETPLTAHDFAFAFERIFTKNSLSPSVGFFTAIKGAEALLSGETPEFFGVTAEDDTTLVITLSRPDPDFLYALTLPAAMPCNREYFLGKKGKYGQNYYDLMYNGPFRVSEYRDKEYWRLRVNKYYPSASEIVSTGVRIYYRKLSGAEALNEGVADIASVTYGELGTLSEKTFGIKMREKRVWTIALNCASPLFSDVNARLGVSSAINYSALLAALSDDCTLANSLIPASMKLGGKSYRELTGDTRYVGHDLQSAKVYMDDALSSVSEPPERITLYCPDSENFLALAASVQTTIRDVFSLTTDIVPLSEKKLLSALPDDYDIAIMPFDAECEDPYTLLGGFAKEGNLCNFADPEYNAFLSAARAATSPEESASMFKKAERILIENAVLLPIAYEPSYFAVRKSVKNISMQPFSETVFFKSAVMPEA